MRLYKRGNQWWADLRAEGLGRMPTGCTDKVQARKAAKRLVDGGQAGKTLATALNKAWLEHYKGTKGARNAQSIHNQLREDIGTLPLERVTTPLLKRYVEELKTEGNTGSTINRKLAHIGKTLKLACEWGWMDNLPHIPRQKEVGKRHREVTEFELQTISRLLSGNPKHIWLLGLASFLLDTGARLSEALSITEVDRARALDTGMWTIWVNKGDRPRTIPLTGRAQQYLTDWMWRGRTPRQAQKAWDWVRGVMGLSDDPGFVLHCLRHTCASRMVQRGVPLLTVKEILGHSTVAVTERYAVMNADHLKAAVSVLETVPPANAGS